VLELRLQFSLDLFALFCRGFWALLTAVVYLLQAIRQSLLTMWKYCFPAGKVPAVLMSSSNSDGRVMDKIFGAVLPIDRLLVQNPNDSALRIEQVPSPYDLVCILVV
jgi:hypothetical protein